LKVLGALFLIAGTTVGVSDIYATEPISKLAWLLFLCGLLCFLISFFQRLKKPVETGGEAKILDPTETGLMKKPFAANPRTVRHEIMQAAKVVAFKRRHGN